MGYYRSALAVIGTAGLLGACATIMEGTTQSVQITTTPPGAHCSIAREGAPLGEIASTPGSVQVSKSKNDLAVTCSLPGYQTATIAQSPSFSGTTFGNIVVGGGIGAIADAASGANYYYPSQVVMTLAATGPVAAPLAPVMGGPLPQRR